MMTMTMMLAAMMMLIMKVTLSLSLFEGDFVLPSSDDLIVNLRFNDGCKINFSSYFHIFQHGEKRK